MAEEVFVIQEQFLQAGAGHVGEAEFGLRGGGRGAAAFGDVLTVAAGGLDHLVDGTRAWVEEALAEPDGGVVDEGGGLEAGGLAVATGGAEFVHCAGTLEQFPGFQPGPLFTATLSA